MNFLLAARCLCCTNNHNNHIAILHLRDPFEAAPIRAAFVLTAVSRSTGQPAKEN